MIAAIGRSRHKGSAESKDGEEEIKQSLKHIEKKLGELSEGVGNKTS